MKLILASKSPRRKEILENLGIKFSIAVSDADEHCGVKNPAVFVKEVSLRKALAAKDKLESQSLLSADDIILSCDTVVAIDGKILGKPADKEEAYKMLRLLSGRHHLVLSGITLIKGGAIISDHSQTEVYFDQIPEAELHDYIKSGEPFDKAGGYAAQGTASLWINRISGCYFNVVGLPANKLEHMLRENFGCSLRSFTQ